MLNVATGRELVASDIGRQRLGAWFFTGFGLAGLAASQRLRRTSPSEALRAN